MSFVRVSIPLSDWVVNNYISVVGDREFDPRDPSAWITAFYLGLENHPSVTFVQTLDRTVAVFLCDEETAYKRMRECRLLHLPEELDMDSEITYKQLEESNPELCVGIKW